MMMKKRRIQAMFIALTAAAVFFTGCPTGHGNTGESGDPEPEDGKTYILFQNANPYAVDVYSDSSRVNKAATIPAGRESRLEWTPNPDGSSFYLTYQIPVGDDVLIPYNPPWIVTYRIDEGKITSIAIASLVSSPNLITDRVYLLLYNESGNEAFHLEQQGRIPIKPEKLFSGNESVPDSISLVNPDERAWYIISAGSAAAYSVSASGAQKPFPEFQAGWFYTFHYTGGGLTLDTAHPLNLEVLLSVPVTFDADGGSPAMQKRMVMNSGDSLGAANMPVEPAKSGYGFDGWYTAVAGGGTQFTASTVVSANITVYAKWILQYTVTFDAAGGSPETQTRTVNSGASVGAANMPDEPTKSGYGFGGWYTETTGGGTQFTASTVVSGNITVDAKWILQYTVTFDAAGGSPETQTRTVNSGDSLGAANMPDEPAKSGYGFGGWYTATNGGGTQFTASTVVSGNITVYARWIPQYTVTFDAADGSSAAQTRTVNSGASVGAANMPDEPAKSGYGFGGWYTAMEGGGTQFTASTVVTANITVYAMWMLPLPANLSLAVSLAWITSNAVEGGAYTITLSEDETVSPQALSYSGKTVSITLSGGTSERKVSLSSNGALFAVGSGVTLTMDNNVTLQGRSDNTNSLVQVNSGGALVMNSGSKISGNTSGGVFVYGGAFTMHGGTISDNTAGRGGGVFMYGGAFTMTAGTISGNTASFSGGGVYMDDRGTFTMNGGEISGNTTASYGGGVYVDSGTFTKSGGIIYGSNASTALKNTASSDGHAVFVSSVSSGSKKRNSTAGEGVTLNSSKTGAAGGWQ
jgi:uncharacterized repeat protein (TIGR02543 family)